MSENKTNLKQYLLGALNEQETEIVDLKIIDNEILEEDLLIAESLLIEEFLEGMLSEGEAEQFNKNFMVSPEREKQVIEIASLKRFVINAKSKKSVKMSEESKSNGFFESFRRDFVFQPVHAIFAVGILGILFATIWMLNLNFSEDNNFTPLEAEFAKLNKTDLSDLNNYQSLKRLNIVPGISRSDENGKQYNKNELSERVFFRLALRGKSEKPQKFKITFIRDGKTVFTQNQIRSYKNLNGEEIRILVPQSILKQGNYLIKVNNNESTEIVYTFSII